MTRFGGRVAGGLAIIALGLPLTACRSASENVPPKCPLPDWDVAAAEVQEWFAEDPDFAQDRALEGSGLVADGSTLFATSEKYHRLLKIDSESLEVEVLELDVPEHSELEGVTLIGRKALLCDEAHAAVLLVDLETADAGGRLAAVPLHLQGVEVEGGKLGLEGITALEDGSHRVFLLLERSTDEDGRCISTVFPMKRADDDLEVDGEPLVIALEDCNWRLTGLQWWKGWLLALKTRYPGEEYEVVTIDTVTGSLTSVLDLTDTLIAVRDQGWSNNVEGITVTPDGALWLLSDNAMTGVIDLAVPPPAADLTLLMRIPAAGPGCAD